MAQLSSPTDFHVASTLTVQSAQNSGMGVTSSAGPANCLRLRAEANMWSENGCQVSLKNVGAQGLLHLKELRFVQPVEIRFVDGEDAKGICAINGYKDSFGVARSTRHLIAPDIRVMDSVSVRPWGLVRSMQNITCSINGSSWQCTPASFIDGMEAIFGNCRYDEYGGTGAPPFNNYGGIKPCSEPGRYNRCVNSTHQEIIHTAYSDAGDASALVDIVYRFDLITKLPISVFNYACFPALENTTNNSLDSAALIQDLSFEITYRSSENPILEWFACPAVNQANSQAVDMAPLLSLGVPDTQDMVPTEFPKICARRMWESVVAREATIGTAEALAAGRYVNMLRPYLMYSVYEPSPGRHTWLDEYTLPSIVWTSYKKHVEIKENQPRGRVSWDYIHLVNMPPLICISCCEASKNKGDAIGGRQPTWDRGEQGGDMGDASVYRRGMSWSNISCRPDFSTLKINLSVKNAVLGSLDGSLCTRMDFYRMYLKYSKTAVSYADWDKYLSGFIVFSPQELCSVGFAHGFAPFSVSISFDFERTACEEYMNPRDYLVPTALRRPLKPDRSQAQAYDVTLSLLGEEKVTLTNGECAITRIAFDNATIQQAFTSAVKRLDEPVLDQFVSQST